MPPDGPNRTVVRITGDHSLRDTDAVKAAVSNWLAATL
jgi:spore coat polysaccharide biosynthesis protein SpsF (cytidylyltransferase family)